MLGNSELAIIPGLYGVWMLFTGFDAVRNGPPAGVAVRDNGPMPIEETS
ncbi:MAG: hypothetical protein AAF945_00910 [Actinomycetota bacterium]